MKKRTEKKNTSLIPREFAHLYILLDNFKDHYEDGERQITELLDIVADVYREEYGEELTRRTAANLLTVNNERGAGRKPAGDRERMRKLSAEGKTVREIALICGVSERTVYRAIE